MNSSFLRGESEDYACLYKDFEEKFGGGRKEIYELLSPRLAKIFDLILKINQSNLPLGELAHCTKEIKTQLLLVSADKLGENEIGRKAILFMFNVKIALRIIAYLFSICVIVSAMIMGCTWLCN